MVVPLKYWEQQRKRAQRILEYRIAHHEKHGVGLEATKEKAQLLRLKKHRDDMGDKK